MDAPVTDWGDFVYAQGHRGDGARACAEFNLEPKTFLT